MFLISSKMLITKFGLHTTHPPTTTTGTLGVVVVQASMQRRHLEYFPVFKQIFHYIVKHPLLHKLRADH